MKEENLRSVPVTDLVDLMVQCIGELSAFKKLRDKAGAMLKSKEVQLIQKVIELKRRESLSFSQ